MLYKYCHPDRIDILRTGRLMLSRPRAFNDPFELTPHVSKFDDAMAMGDYLWRRTKDFVILSLTENRDSLLMWAHYADRHRGFLIGFDSPNGDILSVGSPHRDFGPVSYSHHRPSRERLKEFSNQELFYTKSSEWAYEREWRIVDSLYSADGDAVDPSRDCWPFRFKPEAVTEIIVGHRATQIMPDMFDVLRHPDFEHVTLSLALPDMKRFALSFRSLPRDGWGPGRVEGMEEGDEGQVAPDQNMPSV